MSEKYVFSYPRLGDYHIVISGFLEDIFPGHNVFAAPPVTEKTLELGSRHSPDFVCSPFKVTLGNYIEALEAGANVLLQTGLGCRFGYYGEVQEQILRDLGYDFTFLCFSREMAWPNRIYRELHKLNPGLGASHCARAALTALYKIHIMDGFMFYLRENIGFEARKGSFQRLQEELYEQLKLTKTLRGLSELKSDIFLRLRQIELDKPERPLRVGLVGDLYTLMEPSGNFYLENELAKNNISISRMMSVSFLIKRSKLRSLRGASGYLKYTVGANGVDSVCQSREYGRLGYDGIIHMKSFGCTPEINAIPSLQRISADYGMPILHLSFDTQTSETGVRTRLEAFADMLEMRRKNTIEKNSVYGSGRRLSLD